MSRELLLLRHGKSDWGTDADSDAERPLAKRGRKAIDRMARWVVDNGVVPDLVVSSPAVRARETAQRVCRRAGVSPDLMTLDPTIYEAGVLALLEVLARCPVYKHRVMLVGHNPGLEDLLLYLGGGQLTVPANGKLVPTGALARLELPDDWSALGAGSARVVSVTRPRDLES